MDRLAASMPEKWRPLFGKVVRCLSVSVLTTLLSLTVLGVLVAWFEVTAWKANVVATAVGTVPSFLLNRRWVWGRTGRGSVWREALPFTALSFTGLALSTLAVDRADTFTRGLGLSTVVRTTAVLGANVAAFGLLWVVQFLLLDRILFANSRAVELPSEPTADGELVSVG